DEARERLREQANQLGAPAVVRLIDLLHVAVDDMRQGGDPRLPLELALVKVTRPGSDLSRESMAYRLEQLERAGAGQTGFAGLASRQQPVVQAASVSTDAQDAGSTSQEDTPEAPLATNPSPPGLALEQLQEAWRRSVLPAVEQRPS